MFNPTISVCFQEEEKNINENSRKVWKKQNHPNHVFLPISETSRPAKNRRKRKGAAAAAAGGPGGGPMSNKKRSPGPNFSLASQVCK